VPCPGLDEAWYFPPVVVGGVEEQASGARRVRGAGGDVAVNPGVAEDSGESAALELAVKRNHERSRVLFVLEAHMTAALADGDPADFLERDDQLLAGNDRQPLAHAGSGSVRRTIPISSERPSSRSPST
jgi:hypothetical protein